MRDRVRTRHMTSNTRHLLRGRHCVRSIPSLSGRTFSLPAREKPIIPSVISATLERSRLQDDRQQAPEDQEKEFVPDVFVDTTGEIIFIIYMTTPLKMFFELTVCQSEETFVRLVKYVLLGQPNDNNPKLDLDQFCHALTIFDVSIAARF